jgi:hypothetical protein
MASATTSKPFRRAVPKDCTIQLDVAQNQIWTQDGSYLFSRRWEVATLSLLLDAARSGARVTQAELQAYLARLGQASPLTRAQLLRIVDSLKQFCVQNESLGLQLLHAPRHASVGPWSVALLRALVWCRVDTATGTDVDSEIDPQFWPYPLLLTSATPRALALFLQALVVSEGFAMYGQNLEALETLPSPDAARLTPECAGLLQLRHIDLLRRSGQFVEAKKLATALSQSASATSMEPRLASQATFALDRIKYDDNPMAAWPELMQSPPPPSLLMPDPATMGEWHNLRAISLRRAIIALMAREKTKQKASICDDAPKRLFTKMMRHFESALYMATSLQRWDRLHAYLDNTALCLQELMPFGFCEIDDVIAFYEQALACSDKLDSGNDDAWDMIFYGEFWLKHETELKRLRSVSFSKNAWVEDALRPDDKKYWVRLLERIRRGGAARQMGIALLLFSRWAAQHRDTKLRDSLLPDLLELYANNPGLQNKLASEGYAAFLPV